MGVALKNVGAPLGATAFAAPSGPLPPVLRVTNPLEHARALWPGYDTNEAFGSKSVWPVPHRLRPQDGVDQVLSIRRGSDPEDAAEEHASIGSYLSSLENQPDKYITANTFFGYRRHETLKCLTSFYVDLDLALAKDYGNDFMRLRQDALDLLSAAQIPAPNLAVHTGRGVHLYWLFSHTLPAVAYPRWKPCVQRLVKILKPVGADSKAVDTARVLRLVGTLNSKCPIVDGTKLTYWKTSCEVLQPQRYSFDFLSEQILPYSREEVAAFKANWQKKILELGPEQAKKRVTVRQSNAPGDRVGRHYSATAITRLADIELLASTLYPNGVPEGKRDFYLFQASVNLAWMCRSQTLETEILKWKNRFVPSMTDHNALSQMGTVMRKAMAAYANGGRVSVYNDERYVFSAKTVWELFEEEVAAAGLASKMQSLASEEVRAARKAAAKKAANADNYTGQGIRKSNVALAVQAREMAATGMTTRAIGELLGTSNKTISMWLKLEPAALGLADPILKSPSNVITAPIPHRSYPQPAIEQPALPKSALNMATPNGFQDLFLETEQPGGVRGGEAPPRASLNSANQPQRQVLVFRSPLTVDQMSAEDPLPTDTEESMNPTIPRLTPRGGLKTATSERPIAPGRQKYSPQLLTWLREVEVTKALQILGVHYKLDASYIPRKDQTSCRLHISTDGAGVHEVVATGPRFIDKASPPVLKGAGAIDIAMQLLGLKFDQAVKRLLESPDLPIGLRQKIQKEQSF